VVHADGEKPIGNGSCVMMQIDETHYRVQALQFRAGVDVERRPRRRRKRHPPTGTSAGTGTGTGTGKERQDIDTDDADADTDSTRILRYIEAGHRDLVFT
jgi:hypothetical protein